MDIRVTGAISAYQVYNTNKNDKTRKTSATGNDSGRDAFTLSMQAEDYQQVRNALTQVPDVRTDRVDVIRQRIEAGQYNVSAAAVADRILQNIQP